MNDTIYAYQAELYCEACGDRIRAELDAAGKSPAEPDDQHTYDSTDYPKAAQAGETDSPNHCAAGGACPDAEAYDGHAVGALLPEDLTSEGVSYVRGILCEEPDSEYQRQLHARWAEAYPEAAPTISDWAGAAYKWFETAHRPDGETYDRIRDGAPEWIGDVTYAAHGAGDILPDDYRYEWTRAALAHIADGGYDTADDARDDAWEFADSSVGVMNATRFAWLASDLSRQGYVDEAMSEFGPFDSIAQAIGAGMAREAEEVYYEVVQALENHAENVYA